MPNENPTRLLPPGHAAAPRLETTYQAVAPSAASSVNQNQGRCSRQFARSKRSNASPPSSTVPGTVRPLRPAALLSAQPGEVNEPATFRNNFGMPSGFG